MIVERNSLCQAQNKWKNDTETNKTIYDNRHRSNVLKWSALLLEPNKSLAVPPLYTAVNLRDGRIVFELRLQSIERLHDKPCIVLRRCANYSSLKRLSIPLIPTLMA
jgi:hypothetical protein